MTSKEHTRHTYYDSSPRFRYKGVNYYNLPDEVVQAVVRYSKDIHEYNQNQQTREREDGRQC